MSFKFDFTEAKLRQILVGAPHVDQWFLALQEILPDYEIDTAERVACFIGQTAHESGGYRAVMVQSPVAMASSIVDVD